MLAIACLIGNISIVSNYVTLSKMETLDSSLLSSTENAMKIDVVYY